MTLRLYYNDSYTTQFTARIIERIELDGRPAVILDRTYFYPTGGGQPCDRGVLNGVPVLDVFPRDTDHEVVHVLEQPLNAEIITGVIDWTRRFDHMQQHTGQHMLTQAFVSEAGANTISFHLSPNSVTIDLDIANLSNETVHMVEAHVNQIVQENRPVTARVVDPDEASQLGARIRRIPGHLATGGLRVIEIEDYDLTACGGTHVAHTGEIGLIKVIKSENYKGATRVEFACGGRAQRDYALRHAITSELASMLTVGLSDIPDSINRLRADLKAAQSDLKHARASLMELEAPALLASAEQAEGYRVVCRGFENRDSGDIRALASKLTQEPDVIALLGAAGEKAMLFCARSADLPHDMNAALKTALSALGDARGGGRPDFAQGGGIPATLDQVERALSAASQAISMAASQ